MIIAVVSDLMFRSKLKEGLEGTPIQFVRSVTALAEAIDGEEKKTVIVDLACSGIDPVEAITAAAKAPAVERIVAYGSHVEVDAFQRAKEAGAHDVMPRSKFVTALPSFRAQRGVGIWTLLVFGTVIFCTLHYLYHVIPIYYGYYELRNHMASSIMLVASQDKMPQDQEDRNLRQRLKQVIREYNIPIDVSEIRVERKDNYMRLSVEYREVYYVTFRGKDYIIQTFDFDATEEGTF